LPSRSSAANSRVPQAVSTRFPGRAGAARRLPPSRRRDLFDAERSSSSCWMSTWPVRQHLGGSSTRPSTDQLASPTTRQSAWPTERGICCCWLCPLTCEAPAGGPLVRSLGVDLQAEGARLCSSRLRASRHSPRHAASTSAGATVRRRASKTSTLMGTARGSSEVADELDLNSATCPPGD